MKKMYLILSLLAIGSLSRAQDSASGKNGLPLTITLFSESVSLPNFRNIFNTPSLGIRIGTELYYSRNADRQLLQTINVGYYYHRDLQRGMFLNSEFGYRRFFKNAFADATIGIGYLLIDSALPRYENTGTNFQRIKDPFGRIMPSIGFGAGYQFNNVSIFSRYEMFGETPFGLKGVPALPHKAIHVGTRFNLK